MLPVWTNRTPASMAAGLQAPLPSASCIIPSPGSLRLHPATGTASPSKSTHFFASSNLVEPARSYFYSYGNCACQSRSPLFFLLLQFSTCECSTCSDMAPRWKIIPRCYCCSPPSDGFTYRRTIVFCFSASRFVAGFLSSVVTPK